MITVEEHLATINSTIQVLGPQRVPLSEAHGLVLGADMTARAAVPPFDNSAMDGFAVRHADIAGATQQPVRLDVAGDLPAGAGRSAALSEGQALRIMTGGPVPEGADTIVPVEATDQPLGAAEVPAEVTIHDAPDRGRHIRRAGEDVAAGAQILARGTRLGAAQLSSLASVGHGDVLAHRRPRIGVLATGAELREPGSPVGPGQIPDSNTDLLAGLVAEAGCQPVRLPRLGDDVPVLRTTLAKYAPHLDGLITSGGVSVGAFDVVKLALADEPDMTFVNVAMQPGKPQGFGRWGTLPVFCLPGNPVSVFVSFHVLIHEVLVKMAGRTSRRRWLRGTTATGWRCPPGRRQYMPVTITEQAGTVRLRPAAPGGSGSHLIGSLAACQGLAMIAADVAHVAQGDELPVIDLRD